jgi:hypothetical protein
MQLICKVFCSDEYADVFEAAKIELTTGLIDSIKQLQGIVKVSKSYEGFEISVDGFMGTPGKSPDDFNTYAYEWFLVDKATKTQFEDTDDLRAECIRLHINETDFWWSGYGYISAHLVTCRIPISIFDSKLFTKESL